LRRRESGWDRAGTHSEGDTLVPTQRGEDITMLADDAGKFGYAAELTGIYDDTTRDIVTALQQHFRSRARRWNCGPLHHRDAARTVNGIFRDCLITRRKRLPHHRQSLTAAWGNAES